MDFLINFGYVVGAIGFVVCIVSYFFLPKMIKLMFEDDENKEQ